MKILRFLKTVLAASLLATAGAAHATTYDAVQGFSSPGSIWSYSYAGTPFTTLVGLPNPFGGAYLWSAQPVPYSASVLQNISGGQLDYETIQAPNNSLTLDPESLSNVTVTFTAPSAGTYAFSGDFLAVDTGTRSHDVEVDINGSAYAPSVATLSSFGASDPFSGSVVLAKGGAISFVVGGGSLQGCGFCNLSTGLVASVSAVPEPASWAMMLAGFGGLGAAMRSRRKMVAAA